MRRNNGFVIFVIVLLIAGAGILMIKDSNTNGNVVKEGKSLGNIQKIVLGFKNYNYYPNTVTVKANQPIRIYLDKSVGGCYRSFTIREMGIAKYLATEKDYVEFTLTKQGIYRFHYN